MRITMDVHVILRILMDYCEDFQQWKSSRILNTTFKRLVDTKDYDRGCFGKGTFICTEWCNVCQKGSCDVQWLRYQAGTIGEHRWISHCRTWFCRMSALYSMIEDCKVNGIFLLRRPWQTTKDIVVPRSSGERTAGHCNPHFVVGNAERHYFVHAEWKQNNQLFYKLVPLSYYTNEHPQIIFQTKLKKKQYNYN